MEQNNNREVIDKMAKELWEMRHTDSFYGIDKKYIFTNDDDFTHAIIINTSMPALKI